MDAPRNMNAALKAVRETVANQTGNRVTLRAVEARARLLDAAALAGINAAEFRELLELALAHSTLPDGPPGEAALAYLVAFRAAQDPVAHAITALRRHGADDDGSRHVLAEWLGEQGQRQLAQAEELTLEIARRARLQ